MKCLFNLVWSPLALIYFGEEQMREGGTPSLLHNFTTNSLYPRAAMARSPHLRSRRTHRALLQEALHLFTLHRAAWLIAGSYGLHIGGPPGQGWEVAGGRTVALDGGATPLHTPVPHLGGREGMQASWRRGAGPWRRGSRTAMSEEQVSRCHTHSGVAESTMCVSQWLTCSWRVTGGGRAHLQHRRHRAA